MREQKEESLPPVTGFGLPESGDFKAKIKKMVISLMATAMMGAALIVVAIGGGVTALRKIVAPR